MTIHILYYDDCPMTPDTLRRLETASGPSIFLAGPTCATGPTPWRVDAIRLFREREWSGTLIVPEFQEMDFVASGDDHFGKHPEAEQAGLSQKTYGVVAWETAGIEGSSCVLFWMCHLVHASLAAGTFVKMLMTVLACVIRAAA